LFTLCHGLWPNFVMVSERYNLASNNRVLIQIHKLVIFVMVCGTFFYKMSWFDTYFSEHLHDLSIKPCHFRLLHIVGVPQ
jgi:hypothetical protein